MNYWRLIKYACVYPSRFFLKTVSCFLLFSVFAWSQCFLAYALYQLIMNSLCHSTLPATKRREKEDCFMLHLLWQHLTGACLLCSLTKTSLWNTCPADVQLIAKSTNRWSTRNITVLAKPLKTLSQCLLQQSVRTLTAKKEAAPGSAVLTWATKWSTEALQTHI